MSFRSRKSVIIAAILGVFALSTLAMCAPSDVLRPTRDCLADVSLNVDGTPAIDENAICSVARYSLPTVPGRKADTFTLAFLELSEKRPKDLKSSDQMLQLQKHLAAPNQKYVIVFVHGWRHDASVGDGDVGRFQTLLAYARNFLDQRVAEGAYKKNIELIGVYVGWRGAQVQEYGGTNPLFVTTFWNRKGKSEAHAQGIIHYLKQVEAQLNLAADDRMLVVGHSFGGNMLATALNACLLGNPTGKFDCGDGPGKIVPIADYQPDQIIKPPLGNLTVLINPASEARNWTELQRSLRERYGRPWKEGGKEFGNWPYDAFFSEKQKPVYASITSTDNWSIKECGNKPCTSYDWATGTMFPLGQSLVSFDDERREAIGHLLPSAERPFGATHEIVTNGGTDVRTKFENSYNPEASRCETANGWLMRTRKTLGGHADWDTGATSRKSQLFVRHGANPVWLQIRQALSPEGKGVGSQPSFESPYTPYWNMRSAQSTVNSHGAFVNYPFWCTLNQMVLDDITASTTN